MVEEFIEGREISVEFISYQGKHYPLQITDKVTTEAPHFVELEHHQPSTLSVEMYDKIYAITDRALTALGLTLEKRSKFIQYMKEHNVQTVFHYLALHSSKYYEDKHDGRPLPECDRYADTLVRLPMFYDLEVEQVEEICKIINHFLNY